MKMEMKEMEEIRFRAIQQLQFQGNTERLENERAAKEANEESMRRQAKEKEVDNQLNSKKRELDAKVAKVKEVDRIEQNKERLIRERKMKAEGEERLRRQSRERQVSQSGTTRSSRNLVIPFAVCPTRPTISPTPPSHPPHHLTHPTALLGGCREEPFDQRGGD